MKWANGSYTTSNSLWVNLEGFAVVLVDRLESVLASTRPISPGGCETTLMKFLSNCSGCLLSNLWLAMTELSPQEVDQLKEHDQV